MSKFSSMLIYLRKREKLSQADLAAKLGVSRSTIGMYETGEREPNFETLEAIADVFNVNMSTLLEEETAIQPTPARQLTPSEHELLSHFNQLNEDGQEKVIEYASDLVHTGIYKKDYQFEPLQKQA